MILVNAASGGSEVAPVVIGKSTTFEILILMELGHGRCTANNSELQLLIINGVSVARFWN